MDTKPHANEKFQDCLLGIMDLRGLSSSQLSVMLGQKSKTTLLRVLQGTAGLRALSNVYKDLCSCEALQLTEQEIERLHIAYDVEMWGADNYRARTEIFHLLNKPNTPPIPTKLLCPDGEETTLEAFLNRFVPAEEENSIPADRTFETVPVARMEILMLSSCYPSVMQNMAALLCRLEQRIHICQLFMLNGDTSRTARMIRNIIPTLGYHTYEAYSISQNDVLPDPAYSGAGTGKAMAIRVETATGETLEFQILLQGEAAGVLLEAPGLWNHWHRFTEIYFRAAVPLKATVPSIQDYVSLLEYYAEIERNREILIYKGDVCFYNIHTEILLHALSDSMAEGNNAEIADHLVQVLPKLRSLQEKRFQNIVNKRQHTYWIASATALYRFARTGIQDDHFFAMRPFTPEERHRIFRHLLEQTENNPYFHMYLLLAEDEGTFVDLEAALFTGRGFQLTSFGTDYCLTNGWTETMLEEEAFCALYREFYMEELLPRHTQPQENTAALLKDILRYLQEEIDSQKA